ncbi:MAG: hypothetical protein JSU95_19100 [Betaproteobacteria bacterium]|nr:MAG: hypothetical protein JSU95_19100 [Betaproteobacteria bacterium]
MDPVETLIIEATQVFGKIHRPEHFTDHKHCCECAEHDETLKAFTPETITREALGHAGWDPMTFATDTGFRYYLPALIRMALTKKDDDYYIDQFLSQVTRDGLRNSRWVACTAEERAVVLKALHVLLEERTEEVDNWLDADRLMQAIEIWSDGNGPN